MLRCVAGFSHICLFIAGATSSGQSLAKQRVDSKSSARPCTSLAKKSALAGATKMASAFLDNSICGMPLPTLLSHMSINTGLPESACMVTGVINWQAAAVITTCTSISAFTNKRTSSAAL